MRTRVVGISHTVGAGGEEVGRAVAERRKGFLVRFIDSLGMSAGAGSVGYIPDLGELGRSEDFRALIREAIQETAERGDVVIASHAASLALAGRDDLLRVLVTASPETRTKRLADAGESDPQGVVKEQDAARADYLRRFHRIDRELSTHYDLVVNTDTLTREQAADVVVHAVQT